MIQNQDKTSQATDNPGTYYKTLISSAIVAGFFCLIVSTLLAVNWYQRTSIDAKQVDKLDKLKIRARTESQNTKLQTDIRELDLQIRRQRVQRLDFSRRGGYLLLGSVALLLICLKLAGTLNKKLPDPQTPGDIASEQIRQTKWSRWSTTTAIASLSILALVLIAIPHADFSEARQAELSFPTPEEISKNWPQFRGPNGQGIATAQNIQITWDVNTGEGIIWKKQVPLPGFNSPIVWSDRIFLSGANAREQKVFCFDTQSGDILWARSVETNVSKEAEALEIGEDTGYAAPSMVTDGQRVCAIFPTGDIGCFDFDGKKLWMKNLGIPDSTYGYASSLTMYRNLVIVQYDQAADDDGKSKLIGLNFLSGSIMWEAKRPVGGSWMSPVVVQTANGPQLIAGGEPLLIAYDPANGAELWRAECLGSDLAPSPILVNDMVIVIEPYTKMTAYKTDGSGDVTETHLVWMNEDYAPDIPSPVTDGKFLYVPDTSGIVACLNASDGKKVWEQDLIGSFQASATLVGDKLYILSYKGIMHILQTGAEYKEIAKNQLGEKCFASPAFMDGRIYIRTQNNLYSIGNKNHSEE
ncbi:MAG: PQQ-binding-like beta-propeller repeat protein [Planctomycetota bacterium]|jgi:outer membrane protein assembly factor BamB